MKKMMWAVQVLLALVFLSAGGVKLATPREQLIAQPSMAWAQDFSATQIKLIGAAEILGAVGLIAPAATGIAPWLTPITALLLAVLMGGALVTHARRGEPFTVPLLLVVFSVGVAVARFRLRGPDSPPR